MQGQPVSAAPGGYEPRTGQTHMGLLMICTQELSHLLNENRSPRAVFLNFVLGDPQTVQVFASSELLVDLRTPEDRFRKRCPRRISFLGLLKIPQWASSLAQPTEPL